MAAAAGEMTLAPPAAEAPKADQPPLRLPMELRLSPDAAAVRRERWQALTPEEQAVERWRANAGGMAGMDPERIGSAGAPERIEAAEVLEGGELLPGLRLALADLWAG